ncbi:hypothetical protein [Streptomyces tsukubensis]|uniref:hypothetical protein n=1 Tax=Streptomyces tsukubensis TaxID=83656 RepID=UPI00344DD43F
MAHPGGHARPGAWLHTTARRRILDRLRRDRVALDHLAPLAHELRDEPGANSVTDPFAAVHWSDTAAEDLLRLVFTCCPRLSPHPPRYRSISACCAD